MKAVQYVTPIGQEQNVPFDPQIATLRALDQRIHGDLRAENDLPKRSDNAINLRRRVFSRVSSPMSYHFDTDPTTNRSNCPRRERCQKLVSPTQIRKLCGTLTMIGKSCTDYLLVCNARTGRSGAQRSWCSTAVTSSKYWSSQISSYTEERTKFTSTYNTPHKR